MKTCLRSLAFLVLLAVSASGTAAGAAETNVAVAANFTAAANDIAAAFEKATGHKAILSFGSSGKLYTQIVNGAPFQVFLSADDIRPAQAEKEGFGVAGSHFTYAIGKLVLYSADPALVYGEGAVLSKPGGFEKIAIANPETAPYGAAAVEVLKAKGLYDSLSAKIVQGDSIAQAHQFIATGNAQLGFVALSQVVGEKTGSQWLVPDDLYRPIRQDAVLLKTGEGNEAASAFFAFLKGPEARKIIEGYGYALD